MTAASSIDEKHKIPQVQQHLSNETGLMIGFLHHRASIRLNTLESLKMEHSGAYKGLSIFKENIEKSQAYISGFSTLDHSRSDLLDLSPNLQHVISSFGTACSAYRTLISEPSGYSKEATLRAQTKKLASSWATRSEELFNSDPQSQVQSIQQEYTERILDAGGDPNRASPGSSVHSKDRWAKTIESCPAVEGDSEGQRLCEIFSSMSGFAGGTREA